MNPPSGVYRQWMSGVIEPPARGCTGGAPDAPRGAARPPDHSADAVRFASILRAAQALSDQLGELCDRL
jgi:hypothetical protein